MTKALLVLLVCLGAVSPLALAQASETESDPWGRLLYEMKAHFGDLNDNLRWVHILPIQRTVAWDSPAGQEDLWDTGDRIAPLTLLYSKGNGRVSLSWEKFIYAIDLGERGANAKNKSTKIDRNREAAGQAWIDAVKKRNDLEVSWVKGYDKSQEGKPKKFWTPWYTWYNENAGPSLAVANKKVADALADYQQYLVPGDADDAAISDCLRVLAAGKLSPGEDPSRLTERRAPYALTGDVGTFIANGKANKSSDKWAFTWSIDHDTTTDHRETSNLGGGASLFGFIKLGGGGSHESINTTHKQFTLAIRFRNLEKMEIKPAGGWFNSGLLDQYENGPYKPGHTKDEFFGPQGKLNHRPIEVILAFQPEVEGTVLIAEYDFFKQAMQGSGGFSIGPFSFNASAGSTLTEEKRDSKTVTFKATNVSDTPQLIAVISAIEQ